VTPWEVPERRVAGKAHGHVRVLVLARSQTRETPTLEILFFPSPCLERQEEAEKNQKFRVV